MDHLVKLCTMSLCRRCSTCKFHAFSVTKEKRATSEVNEELKRRERLEHKIGSRKDPSLRSPNVRNVRNLASFGRAGFSGKFREPKNEDRSATDTFVVFHVLDSYCAIKDNTAGTSSRGATREQTGLQTRFFIPSLSVNQTLFSLR